jgi:hypothetical protein
MKRFHLAFIAASGLGLAAFACGGIADPTRTTERVASVSGALSGTTAVPANARVALVYRKLTATGASIAEVASDVPVVGGRFTFNLVDPPAAYLAPFPGDSISSSTPVAAPEPGPAPAPGNSSTGTGGTSSGGTSSGGSSSGGSSSGGSSGGGSSGGGSSSGGSSGGGANVGTRDVVSGGISTPLSAAFAGFLVYADANGNGALDLDADGAPTEPVLGGNKELVLVFLKDGGTLDYEKLRDKAGNPATPGFNLAWVEGRWLPLAAVDLKLNASATLPRPVCESDATSASSGASGGVATTEPAPAPADRDGGAAGGSYPSPTDPGLVCSADGRSFTYTAAAAPCPTAPTPTPTPKLGLCGLGGTVLVGQNLGCPTSMGYRSALAASDPIPAGWPCAGVFDGGAAPTP